ncbi:hypothetical protein NL108_018467 [Boleophthalmus pectinirostris]|nr:hypothetical protein NL108_018467 [Boleophthalmus pectinirostris]
MNGTCVRSVANATINGDMAKVQMYNISSEFHFLPLGESSWILDIRGFSTNVRPFVQKLGLNSTMFSPELRVQSFYLMSRRPDVSDRDLQMFREHVQCEGFTGDPDYSHKNQEYCLEDESVLTIF